jgi:hypothetical protein
MSTTYSITDFSHGIYQYLNDANVECALSMRNVYATPSGLALATTALPAFLSKHARRRYIYSPTGGNTAPGHSVKRHYPIAISLVATPTAPGTIDGITDFVLKGYRGEQERA